LSVRLRTRKNSKKARKILCEIRELRIDCDLLQVFCFLVLVATSLVEGNSRNVVKRGVFGGHLEPHHRPADEVKYEDHVKATVITKEVEYPVPQPYPVTVEKRVPYVVKVPVQVEVKKPYPVYVEKRVEKKVPYPVEVKVKVPVAVSHHVHVPKPYPVPVHVPKPYPVEVPVYVENKVPVHVKEHHRLY
jgi:hypothetical protein